MGGCTGRLPHPFSFHNKRYFQPHLSLCSFTPPQRSRTRVLEGKTDTLAHLQWKQFCSFSISDLWEMVLVWLWSFFILYN